MNIEKNINVINGKWISNTYLENLLNNAKNAYEFNRGKQKAYAKGQIDILK